MAGPREAEGQWSPGAQHRAGDPGPRDAREREAEAAYLASGHGLPTRHGPAWRLLRPLGPRVRNLVVIEALGQKAAESSGCEVWLLKASCARFPVGIPLHRQRFDPARVTVKENDLVPFGRCLVATCRAEIRLALPPDRAELYFLMHPWSGQVVVAAAGRATVLDLWAPESRVLGVRPFMSPRELFAVDPRLRV